MAEANSAADIRRLGRSSQQAGSGSASLRPASSATHSNTAASRAGATKARSRQTSGDTADVAASSPALRWLPRLIIVFAVLGTLAAMLVLSYEPARERYFDYRAGQQLEAEIAANNARNAQVEALLADLSTDAGIEMLAREEFGWVLPGEAAVNISGLTLEGRATSLPDPIPLGSIPPPDDSLSEILDWYFGYSYVPPVLPIPETNAPGL